ncbi:hypothetical protein GGR53DRAFT_526037 [Hypoxylon sp. FL1150]|nr:hypothetical protein GGR53DRAFT_526037 [Hypoxylon sp. FL1150]
MKIQVPCIAVVGDRSSGKSSVLEAITGLRFPVKDNIGTRFPIELHLCPTSHGQDATFNVRIQSTDSSKQEEFEVNKDSFDESDISGIIDAAEEAILEGGARFSEDALVINMRGPGVPHLSLVDLPGFHPPQEDEQSTSDREIVDHILKRYMAKCIILAIVSAQHPALSQKVLSEVQRYDEDNTRTLGIVTKPDLQASSIKNESDLMCFVKSIDESVRTPTWGWHILRNRSDTEISNTNEERDQKEERFFESGHWSNVLSRNLGSQALRIKLNNILLDYSERDVHGLSKDCKEVIAECKDRLALLGEPRPTAHELRTHLEQLASRFHNLCLHAIEGHYDDNFFGGLFPERGSGWFEDNRIRKLQALLHDQNQAFAHVIRTKGSKRIIIPKTLDVSQPQTSVPTSLQELIDRYDFEEPAKIASKDVVAHLQLLLPAYQGREFPGTVNDTLVVKLFREQAQPWEAIARHHIHLMLSVTEEFVKKLVYHITNPDLNTFSRIVAKIVEPFFDMKSTVLESKLQELLYHYKSGGLQIIDAEYRALLALKRQKNGHIDQVRGPFEKRPQESRKEMGEMNQVHGTFGSEIDDLIDKSETYYEMSLRTFTDNIVILAIENCLIRDLPTIIAADKFKQMTNDELEELASETPDIQEARQQQQVELASMKECLQTCLKWKLMRE